MRWNWKLSAAAVILGALTLPGCEDKPVGPKRADDRAAHARVYHPDIHRPTSPRTAAAPASRPASDDIMPVFDLQGPVGSPVLFVNGEPITVMEIIEPIIDDLERDARILSPQEYVNSATRLVRNQVDYQVSTLCVYQEARKTFSNKRFQEALDKQADDLLKQYVAERYGGVFARFEAHLHAVEMKPEDIKERLKREAMVREYMRERFRPLLREPPRREILQYYQTHKDEFTTPAKAELFLIEVPYEAMLTKPADRATEADWAAARAAARARIERAREELESGVEFEAVARAYSKGPLAEQGGAWGEISPGALTKHWARAAEVLFTLKPGQISDIVETDQALFIVKCGKYTPAHQASFEEAQKQIMDRLLEEQFNRHRSQYLQELLAKATIDKRVEFFQAIFAALPRPKLADKGDAGFGPPGS